MAIEKVFERKPIKNFPSAKDQTFGVSKARYVTHKVFFGGREFKNFISWTKEESSYGAGSTATVVLSMIRRNLSGLPSVAEVNDSKHDLMALTQTVKNSILSVSITTTIVIDGQTVCKDHLEFSGIVANLEADYDKSTLSVECRSYAQILHNSKINEVITGTVGLKKTTSQVVKEYTAKFGEGLKTVDANGKSTVDDFNTTIGSLFANSQTRPTLNVSVWDLFQNFAQRDGADLYVEGNVLYYKKPRPTLSTQLADIQKDTPTFTYTWLKDILSMKITHAALFSHEFEVQVIGYNSKTGESVTATKSVGDAKLTTMKNEAITNPEAFKDKYDTARVKFKKQRVKANRSGRITDAPVSKREKYVFRVDGLTQDDCNALAEKIAVEIARREFVATVKVLARPDMTTRSLIRLVNTYSKATDQVYAIKTLNVSFTMPEGSSDTEGYVATLTLVNHDLATFGTNLGV
jgi:hypothetical protein